MSESVMESQKQITRATLAGRFKLLRAIGEGGYGVVYEAIDLEWNSPVAVKTLQRMEPDALLRFKDEFRALQDLEHRNLVHLGELMCADGMWFFTMELIEGTDFLDYVRPTLGHVRGRAVRGLDTRRLRNSLAQLADALIAVHGSGRVHCDVKPTNIRVDKSGRTVLLDFGLVTAVANTRKTPQGSVLGTPVYMAPEQALGETPTPAADMYAVGVLLYEALTGRPPIEGSGMQVMMGKLKTVPVDPRDCAPEAPHDLCELCMRLLEIPKANRPTSATLLGSLIADNDALAPLVPEPARARVLEAAPFVGRANELVTLRKTFARIGEGKPSFTYLSGESGLGKSMLAQRFASEVEQQEGALVLRSRCYERETVPYKALDGIVDDLARHLDGLDARVCRSLLPGDSRLLTQVFPVLRQVRLLTTPPPSREPQDPNVQRTLAFGALREILARLALERPVLLVMDDLQWTDTDSLHVLGEVLGGPLAPQCMVLATGRPIAQLPAELRAALEPIFRTELSQELALGGLDDKETIELATALFEGAHQSGVFQRIAEEAKGHPLFVVELVRHVEAGHGLGDTRRLEDALSARLELIEIGTRTLLEVLAVASAPIAHSVLARALDLDPTELGRRLAQLRMAYLARSEDRRRSECYHDRVRRCVIDAMDQEVREARHRQLAIALMEVGDADSEQIAEQWACAGDMARAARHYATAAEGARRALAFNRALRLYEQALLHPAVLAPAHVLELRVAYAHALSCAGYAGRAAQAYCDAAAQHDGEPARTLRRLGTQLMMRSGRIEEGLELADSVLAEVGMSRPKTPTRAVVRLLWERTRLWARGIEHKISDDATPADREALELLWAVAPSLSFVDILGGTALQSTYVRMALSSGNPLHVVRALTGHALMMSTMEPPPQPRVTELLYRARQVADSSDEPYLHALVWLAHGYVHWVSFRANEAVAQLIQAERILHDSCVDVAWELTNTRAGLLNALWNAGKLCQQHEFMLEWQRDARERGDRYAATQLTVIGMRYQVSLREDDPERADAVIDEALQGLPTAFQLPQLGAYIGHQLVALYRGDGTAYDLLQQTWPSVKKSRLLHAAYLAFLTHSDAAWACLDQATRVASAKRGDLLHQTEAHAAALAATRRPLAHVFATQIRGQIAVLRDDLDAGVQMLKEAEIALRRSGSVYQYSTGYLLGHLVGGDEGGALRGRAIAWAGKEGVVDPDRWLRMFVPVGRALR